MNPLGYFQPGPQLYRRGEGAIFSADIIMKIVFFSSDRLEVELLSKEMSQAGIPCEVRESLVAEEVPLHVPDAELWIQHDDDTHRAFMLCVERDAGFAKRDTDTLAIDDLLPEVVAA